MVDEKAACGLLAGRVCFLGCCRKAEDGDEGRSAVEVAGRATLDWLHSDRICGSRDVYRMAWVVAEV
jgi:hypothetical protein